LAHERFIVFLT